MCQAFILERQPRGITIFTLKTHLEAAKETAASINVQVSSELRPIFSFVGFWKEASRSR